MEYVSTAEAIRLKREEMHMSCRELARRAGVSSSYVSALETHKIQPSFAVFARIAMVLHFSPAEVYYLTKAESERGS